jgi:DMSO/TMAO reductase YedYZ molybdopterin-dependent catalytic subunit
MGTVGSQVALPHPAARTQTSPERRNAPMDTSSDRLTSFRAQHGDTAEHAGRAGLLAALVMLAVQLIWRLNWSQDGVVQAFPEFIVAAISRLTPISVFGAATENYGSLAKKTLFASVLIGIVAVGFRSGSIAGWLSNRLGRGGAGRIVAGFAVAAALWLVTMLVIMPIAHLGVFATKSSYTSDILVQLSVTFALFGALWALLATPALAESTDNATGSPELSRRAVLAQTGWAAGTLIAMITVGASGWRLINPRRSRVRAATTGDAAPSSVDNIVATQRALQGNPLPPTPTPTPEQVSEAASLEVAELNSDLTLQATPDPIEFFAELDAQHKITPVLTETNKFYHVSKNLTDPQVGIDGWTLKVGGKVNQPLELTYDQVMALATTTKITTLSCISNELNGDLTGTAQWTGFPLKDLLEQAGVQDGVIDVKFHAADDYEDSIPLDRALDPDTFIVTMMNGEPLRDDHGFPVRMIVPGIYGMKNVKWLQEIELVDEDFMGYWQTRGWSDTAQNQIWGRIDQPWMRNSKIEPGPFIAMGVASAGDRDISRVEISLDDGDTWADALLEPSLNPPFTWVRWAYSFDAQPGKYNLRMRATDGTGQVMDEKNRSPLPDGATGWPRRSFEVKSS